MVDQSSSKITPFWRVPIWVAMILAALVSLDSRLAGQTIHTDPGFHDLGDSHTLNPANLLRYLSRYQSKPVNRTPLFDQLENAGRDIFASLSEEQKAKAHEFAEQLIRNEGFDSPKVKSLMNQMGIDENLQQSLAEQFDRESFDDDRFPKGEFQRKLDRGRFNEAIQQSEWRQQSDLLKAWKDGPTQPSQFSSTNDESDSIEFEPWKRNPANPTKTNSTAKSELNAKDSSELPSLESTERPVQPSINNPGNSSTRNSTTAKSKELDLAPRRVPINPSQNSKSTEALLAEVDKLLSDEKPETGSPGSQSKMSTRNSPDRNESVNNETYDSAKQPGNLSSPGAQSAKSFTDEAFAQDFYKLANDVLPKIEGQRRSRNPENFDIDLNKLKELKNLITEKTAEPSQQSIGDWAKKFSDVLGNQTSPETKEKIEARFDRMLIDAAKKSVKSVSDDDGKLSDAFKKVIRSAVDTAKSGVDKMKDSKRNTGTNRSANNNQFDENPFVERDAQKSIVENMNSILGNQSSQSASTSSSGSSSGSEGGSNSGSGSFSPPAIPELGKIDLSSVFNLTTISIFVILVLLVAAGVAIFHKLNPELTDEELHQQMLVKKLRSAMRQPDDLVDAVDLYLLANHGSEASWWNASTASKNVAESKPSMKDKVVSLFQLYVQTRYSPSQDSVDRGHRENAESTLRELVTEPSTHLRAEGNSEDQVDSSGTDV